MRESGLGQVVCLFSEHGMSLQHIWILLTTSYKSKYPWKTILIIQMGKQFVVGFMIEGLEWDVLALKLSKLDKKVHVLLQQSLTRMMSGGLGLWRAIASHLPNTTLWFHNAHAWIRCRAVAANVNGWLHASLDDKDLLISSSLLSHYGIMKKKLDLKFQDLYSIHNSKTSGSTGHHSLGLWPDTGGLSLKGFVK